MEHTGVLPPVAAMQTRPDRVVVSVARNVSVMIAAQVVTFSLSFLLRAVLGRYLGDAGFGKLTFALAAGAIFATIGGLGLGPLVAKEVARSRDLTSHYLTNGIVLRLLIGLPLYGGFCLAVTWLKSDVETRTLTALVGLSLLINLIVTLIGAVFQAHEKMAYVSIGLIVEKLLTTVLGIAAVLRGLGLVSVGWAMVLAALANLLVSSLFLTRLGPTRLSADLRSVQSLFTAGLPFLIWAAFTTIYARIDATMLSLMTTDMVTGWYGVSYSLYETLSFLPGLIKTVVLPIFSRLFVSDEARFRTTFRQMFYCYSLITPAVAFGTYALAEPIVGLIYPLDQFRHSIVILQILALGFIPLFYNILLATAVVAVDRQHIWSYATIVCAVINPAMNLVLIPYFQATTGNGGIGAAWATNVIEVLLLFVGISLLPRGMIGAHEITLAVRAALAGLGMAGMLLWQHTLALPASVLLGAVTYVACCGVLGVLRLDEIRAALAVGVTGGADHARSAKEERREAIILPRLAVTTSIVIPTHDRRDLLQRVLRALSRQSYPADQTEVIVVDDGSRDGTDTMVSQLQTPYRLTVLRQEKRGAATARNAGLAVARGQTVIFLDDDVIPVPAFVAAHQAIHARSSRAVVIGRLLPCPGARRTGWTRWEDAIIARGYQRILQGKVALDGSLFYAGNASAPREVLLDVGGFDPSFASQEDVELGYRLEDAGVTFHFAPDAAGFHCGHYPDLTSWCLRHYRFGVYQRRVEQSSKHRTCSQLGQDRHALTRLLLGFTRRHAAAMRLADSAFRLIVTATDLAHLWPISRLVYSALANLHFWQGVHDGIRADRSTQV